MKNPRITFGVLAVLALSASATAVHLLLENIELRRQLQAAREEGVVASSAPSSASATTRVPDVVAPAPVPTASGVPLAPPSGEANSPAQQREYRRARMAEMADRLANDPEARAALIGRAKSEVDRVYGDLFVKLGLNEDQVDMLRTLLAERQVARMEGEMRARFAADDTARTDARAAAEEKMQSIESGINALLGPDGMTVLEDFQLSQPVRQAVNDVARRASYAGEPLSSEANDRLVAVMQSAALEYPAGNGNAGGWRRETLTQQTVDTQLATLRAQNDAVIAQAKTFLTQPQLEALVSRQIEQYEQTEAQLNVRLRNPAAASLGVPGEFGGGRGGRP